MNGSKVTDIMLDNGAEVSLVAKDLLQGDYKKVGTVLIKPLACPTIECPAMMVPMMVSKRSITVKGAVLDREHLVHHLLLGENMPEINLKDLIAETREEAKQDNTTPRE